MAEYSIQGSTLTAIADAIRAKLGITDTLTPAQMSDKISSIVSYKIAVASEFSKTDSVITETSTLEDGTIGASYISLDTNGNPVSITGGDNTMSLTINYDDSGHATSITIDGTNYPVTWEGFDG